MHTLMNLVVAVLVQQGQIIPFVVLGVPVQMVDFHKVLWLEIKSAILALSVLPFQQFGYLFW